MLPFSTVETIREEKNDITDNAAIEKYLKVSGFTDTSLKEIGKASIPPVVAERLDEKLSMTIKR